jgi:aminopeptidase 2
MRSWVGKVKFCYGNVHDALNRLQIGFPVLTVNETTDGLNIRQDRFLETGLAEPRDNETIWCVSFSASFPLNTHISRRTLPLRLLTVGHDGKPSIDSSLVLRQREMSLPLDMSKPFKLNAGATGFCEFLEETLSWHVLDIATDHVLYTPERFAQIFDEAVKGDGLLTADDRIEIANTVGALAKAGLIPTSTMLTLAVKLRNETRRKSIFRFRRLYILILSQTRCGRRS